jgi:predicted dienelactone hydrolase
MTDQLADRFSSGHHESKSSCAKRPTMSKIGSSEQIDPRRRRFLGTAALSVAAAQLGVIGTADAQSNEAKPTQLPAIKSGTNTSFAPLKQIDAGVLNVGYAEAGPAAGPAVLLLHGWPYDIHSFVDVAPSLASAGYRVIVPYLRGYGSTDFSLLTRRAMANRLWSPLM